MPNIVGGYGGLEQQNLPALDSIKPIIFNSSTKNTYTWGATSNRRKAVINPPMGVSPTGVSTTVNYPSGPSTSNVDASGNPDSTDVSQPQLPYASELTYLVTLLTLAYFLHIIR